MFVYLLRKRDKVTQVARFHMMYVHCFWTWNRKCMGYVEVIKVYQAEVAKLGAGSTDCI